MKCLARQERVKLGAKVYQEQRGITSFPGPLSFTEYIWASGNVYSAFQPRISGIEGVWLCVREQCGTRGTTC